jgi:hypothetical protein
MSDFFDDKQAVLQALKHFRHRNHEVLVFHILYPREIDFKLGDGANFVDMETGEEMVTIPSQLRNSYSKAVKDFINDIRRECYNHNIDYNLIDTSKPFDKALRDYLTKRRKM